MFAEFHRDRRWSRLRRVVPALVVVAAAIVGSGWLIVGHPHPEPSMVLAGPGAAIGATSSPTTDAAPVPVPVPAVSGNADAPAPVTAPPVTASPAPVPAPGAVPREQRTVDITVDTRGFQAELDRCEWVRMDVGAVAPIVGAHNFCHGDVILDLAAGDLVHVAGTDLDGDYQVTGSRDAHAGDDAATATAGLRADLLLQTCYWDDSGLRLVTLRRVDLSLPPTLVPDEAALTTEH